MPTQIDPDIHQRAKWRNRINTLLIVAGLTLLIALCAWALFGKAGILWALALAFVIWMLSPKISPELVLRMYRARLIATSEAPDLYHTLAVLAERADLPAVPKL